MYIAIESFIKGSIDILKILSKIVEALAKIMSTLFLLPPYAI